VEGYQLIRKWLALGIILFFVGTCTIQATAQNIEKSLSTSTGNWLYVGGSEPGNFIGEKRPFKHQLEPKINIPSPTSPYFQQD